MKRHTHTTFAALLLTFITLPTLGSVGIDAASLTDPQKLASANTGFAFKLLKEIAREQPAQNIFVSPYSVSSVIQMVCNGAGGKTKEEMQQVLGTSGMTLAAMSQANQNLSRTITSGSGNVVLNSANAIWYRKGIPVEPEFRAGG
jgi:serpin B